MDNGSKKLSQGALIGLILGGIAIIAAAAVIAVVLLTGNKSEPIAQNVAATQPPSILIAEDAEQLADILAQEQAAAEKTKFTTYMNSTWTFPDGESVSSDGIMGNSEINRYPFWFEVYVGDQCVMTSGLLKVGTVLRKLKLDVDLSAGTYDGRITMHLIDDDGTEIPTGMGFKVTLIVKE